MEISDLLSILNLIFTQKRNYRKKNVMLDGMKEYIPEKVIFNNQLFYISKINDKEHEILSNFFLLKTFENKKSNENDFENPNHIDVKFFCNDEYSVILIPIKEIDKIYGLGLKFNSFNRKGLVFDNFNADNPYHAEYVDNLYSTSNIFYIYNEKTKITHSFILDYPGFVRYDFCKTDKKTIRIQVSSREFRLLQIASDDFYSAVQNIYKLIPDLYKPPFHSFGYTYSHWGIKNLHEIDEIFLNHSKDNIGLSNICLDIDYMESFKNFTINDNFGNAEKLKELSKKYDEKNQFIIPIIDAAFKVEEGYDAYEEFIKNDVIVKDKNNMIYKGNVWPGICIFPDFFKQKAQDIYKNLTKKWIEETGIKGVWLDMNEPSIFNEVNRTLPFNTKFLDGTIENKKIHNMYPYYQAKKTLESFIEKGNRPMLFSRSSYTFMSQFCGNWTGDNQPRLSHLIRGFEQIISLSLSSIMFSGTDIGGFWFNPSSNLLIKWFKVALFHPLFRNHSSIFAKARDIPSLKNRVKNEIKKIIDTRYILMPTIYSLFLSSIHYRRPYIMPYIHEKEGKTVINEKIIVISDTIGYDPFETNLLENDENFIKYNLNGINLYIKKGKAIIISPKTTQSKNIYETAPFKIIGAFDKDNKFEADIYLDDGLSSNSINNYAIYSLIFNKTNKDNITKKIKEIFSNVDNKEKEKIMKILNEVDIEVV